MVEEDIAVGIEDIDSAIVAGFEAGIVDGWDGFEVAVEDIDSAIAGIDDVTVDHGWGRVGVVIAVENEVGVGGGLVVVEFVFGVDKVVIVVRVEIGVEVGVQTGNETLVRFEVEPKGQHNCYMLPALDFRDMLGKYVGILACWVRQVPDAYFG
ncbi:hypothetical protein O6P43_016511 [Quillaja saponaria]|uniref:Uncharacterized protein n=1 Tax=Quillaja saponaria TaxID=32244 RepID=A0AAD7LN43_QUISA|nr:hypothetical protein O6P43_016511 [Quillaja saponaria]